MALRRLAAVERRLGSRSMRNGASSSPAHWRALNRHSARRRQRQDGNRHQRVSARRYIINSPTRRRAPWPRVARPSCTTGLRSCSFGFNPGFGAMKCFAGFGRSVRPDHRLPSRSRRRSRARPRSAEYFTARRGQVRRISASNSRICRCWVAMAAPHQVTAATEATRPARPVAQQRNGMNRIDTKSC